MCDIILSRRHKTVNDDEEHTLSSKAIQREREREIYDVSDIPIINNKVLSIILFFEPRELLLKERTHHHNVN